MTQSWRPGVPRVIYEISRRAFGALVRPRTARLTPRSRSRSRRRAVAGDD